MMTALSVETGQQVRDMAEAADCSYTDLLAALVKIGLDHLEELPPNLQPKEDLPLAESA
jgi:hypothetical protein